uniref:Peptidase S1 domain-containing protein n=1 Tax=Steinernema glaseri TaxID=37863 RepID=A0A1I7YG21_9BILA
MQALLLFLALLGLSTATPLPKEPLFPDEEAPSELVGLHLRLSTFTVQIFGGIHSQLGQWPSQVFIYYTKNSTGKKSMCGGTLISPRHVLTAAHCTELTEPSLAMTGVTDIKTALTSKDVQIREISSFERHPDYDEDDTFANDIAVLTLNASVTLDKTAQLMKIKADDSALIGVGHGMVTGYGVHLVLHNQMQNGRFLLWADVPFKNNTWCTEHWKTISGNKVHIKPNQICYGAQGKGTGPGDSGGPVQVLVGGSWYQVGAVSFGVGQVDRMPDQDEYPSVGIRIAPYCDFLEKATKNAFKCIRD